MIIFRILLAFLLSVAVAASLGSLFHSFETQNALIAAGLDFPLGDRMRGAFEDYLGLVPGQYGAVIAIALALGFVVAAVLRRVLKPLAGVAFPLAGAAAVALTLYLMSQQFYTTTPIAGARGPIGFGLQCLAGAIGGLVFGTFFPPRRG
ncbi:MAG: hypothetical protein K2Q06_03885 [Parvularculaceae bacterium]|nr:hypothetical protein [Parvularculaceae bacterium]